VHREGDDDQDEGEKAPPTKIQTKRLSGDQEDAKSDQPLPKLRKTHKNKKHHHTPAIASASSPHKVSASGGIAL
jgi:hypothetical protein